MNFKLGNNREHLWEDVYRVLTNQLPNGFGYIGELGLFLCIESYELILQCSEESEVSAETGLIQLILDKPKSEEEYISLHFHSRLPIHKPTLTDVFESIKSLRESPDKEIHFEWKKGFDFPIFSIMKTLSRLGSSKDHFQLQEINSELHLEIRLYWKKFKSVETRVILPFITQVDSLPSPSSFLEEIQLDLENKNISLSKISRKLEMNPSFAIEILKLANSGFFSRQKPIESLESAIMTIGINGIKKLILVAKFKELTKFNKRRFLSIWEHSQKTAFIARELALPIKSSLAGTAYISGLLHDMGKLLLSSQLENIPLIIKQSAIESEIYSDFLEEILLGIGHTTIGGLLARKWNFPDDLKSAVEFHHRPWDAPEPHKQLVNTIYLANILSTDQEFTLEYDVVNKTMLSDFNVHSKEELENLRIKMNKNYNKYLSEN